MATATTVLLLINREIKKLEKKVKKINGIEERMKRIKVLEEKKRRSAADEIMLKSLTLTEDEEKLVKTLSKASVQAQTKIVMYIKKQIGEEVPPGEEVLGEEALPKLDREEKVEKFVERVIRYLQKKLRRIAETKEKQEQGKPMDAGQLEMLKKAPYMKDWVEGLKGLQKRLMEADPPENEPQQVDQENEPPQVDQENELARDIPDNVEGANGMEKAGDLRSSELADLGSGTEKAGGDVGSSGLADLGSGTEKAGGDVGSSGLGSGTEKAGADVGSSELAGLGSGTEKARGDVGSSASDYKTLLNNILTESEEITACFMDKPLKWYSFFPFHYIVFQIRSKVVIGTAILLSTEDDLYGNSIFDIITHGGIQYAVHLGMLITFQDWLTTRMNQMFARSFAPYSNEEIDEVVGLVALQQLGKIMKVVRTLLISGGNAYTNLENCFGFKDDNQLYFFKSPQGNQNFRYNNNSLKIISNRIDKFLLDISAGPSNNCRRLLAHYKYFCNTMGNKTFTGDSQLVDCFSLHHPVSFSDQELLRFFMNLGALSKSPNNLTKNKKFVDYINFTLTDWVSDVCKHPVLQKVFNFPRGLYKSGYAIDELPIFCVNVLKHYGDRANQQIGKQEVIRVLCECIPDLPSHMFNAFASAVFGGYTNNLMRPYYQMFLTDF